MKMSSHSKMTPFWLSLLFSIIICLASTIVVSAQEEDATTVTQQSQSQSWMFIIVALSGILLMIALAFIFFPAIVSAYGPRVRYEEIRLGKKHTTSSGNNHDQQQQQQQQQRPLLSLVIPAYNEELRLEIMLQEAYDYLSQTPTCPALQELQKAATATTDAVAATTTRIRDDDSNKSILVEWIVVNDGSTDDTAQVKTFIQKIQQQQQPTSSSSSSSANVEMQWKLINLLQNSGKGAAVQVGMLSACPNNSSNSSRCGSYYSLMVDADGATEFGTGLERLASHAAASTSGGAGGTHFILGSRAQERNDADDSNGGSNGGVQRTLIRRFLQSLFHAFVVLLVGTSEVQDTQCGFKLFQGSVVPDLFQELHLRRWAFDTELLVRGKHLNLNIKEIVVPWHEVDGSKLNTSPYALVRVAISMLRDMICVRLCYSLKIWKVESTATTATNTSNTKSSTTTTPTSPQERKEQ
jgi:dolichyl-phosphate beta-glucosyltransferase